MENKGKIIEKLNGRNYVPWSYRMKLFLKNEKCWDVIENDQRPNRVTVATWTKMGEQAAFYLGAYVEDSQLPIIKRTNSPKAAWDALSNHHKKASFSNKIRLLRKMYQEVLPKNGDMEAHLTKLMDYYDQLCEIGHVLDNEVFVSIVLTSVGDDYDNLVTALDCREEADLTLELVKTKLLDEYDRKKKSDSSNGMAMKVFSKPPVNCHFCDKKGHVKKYCTKFMEWMAAEKEKNEKTANKYDKFKKNGPDQKSHSANIVSAEEDEKSDEYANYAFCVQKSTKKINGWFIDSGATCHITNNINFFLSIDFNFRQSITVANGETVWSSGKGHGTIIALDELGEQHEIIIHDVLYVPQVNANLLSVKKLTSLGYEVHFSAERCIVKSGGYAVIVAKLQNGLYKINENQCYHTMYTLLA